jgi:hypothetical protein
MRATSYQFKRARAMDILCRPEDRTAPSLDVGTDTVLA